MPCRRTRRCPSSGSVCSRRTVSEKDAPAPVRPDYGGAWIGGIIPALLDAAHAGWLPEPARAARAVVVLVLDGVGWHFLEQQRSCVPTLAGMVGGPITAVAPTTTAAGLTSISTGAPPGEHGLVGYRIRVAAQVLNVLRWTVPHRGTPPPPARTQPLPPFLGHPVAVVTNRDFRETGFTEACLRGGDFHGWVTPATIVEHCRRLVADGQRLVYAYYDGVDKVAHAHGLRDRFLAAELAAADALVAALLAELPGDCALLVTADHGQVHVEPDDVVTLDTVAPLVTTYAGESRFRSLWARAGAIGELTAAARETYGDVAWVLSREQLCDEGWLGPVTRPEVRGRVGDVVLAPFAAVGFSDPTYRQEDQLVSRHGSLTRAEMLVPLLAAYGTGSSSRSSPA